MSEYRIVWQDEAYANLLSIRDDIERASYSVEIANKVLGMSYARVEELTRFPYRYPVFPDRPILRRMVVDKDYCVFYRVIEEGKAVRILNIFWSRADAPLHIDPSM